MIDTRAWSGHGVATPATPGLSRPMLVHDVLDRAARRAPDAPALSDATGTSTYAELATASRRAATLFLRHGVRPGSRVAVTATPGRQYFALLYGASRIGAAFVPLHVQSRPYQLAQLLADARPALVIVPDDEVAKVPASDATVLGLSQTESPEELIGPQRVFPEAPALMFFTSGSSGHPKGVVCSHAQVTFAARSITSVLRYRADDVVFLRLPLAFDYGLYQGFLCALAGAHLVLADHRDNVGLLHRLRAVNATVLPVVPTLAQLVLALGARDPRPTGLRMITNTGEHLPQAVQHALGQAFPGAGVALMYGLTECKRVSVLAPGGAPTDSVGPPIPGTEVAVLDERGRPVPTGEVGEITSIGPHVADGYWGAPGLSARRFARCASTGRRIVRTGDLGTLDEQGHIRVHGREDGIFKNAGTRMSVFEIEAAALDVPGVRNAVVVPPRGREPVTLWIAGSLAPLAMLTELRKRIEPAKVPVACHVLPDLPTTPNGKLDRVALAAMRQGSDRG